MSQMNPQAPMQKQSGFSKWWPISFFIAAIVMFIVGGGLFGAYTSSATSCVDSFYNSYYSNYGGYGYGCTGNVGEFYGGVACLAIGGILKLVGWVLLIVFCVKRRRALHQQAVTHYYAPPAGQYPQQYAPQPYGPQAPYNPQPFNPQPAGYPSAYPARSPAASPAPNNYAQPVAPYQAPDASASPPPNGQKEAMTSTHYA